MRIVIWALVAGLSIAGLTDALRADEKKGPPQVFTYFTVVVEGKGALYYSQIVAVHPTHFTVHYDDQYSKAAVEAVKALLKEDGVDPDGAGIKVYAEGSHPLFKSEAKAKAEEDERREAKQARWPKMHVKFFLYFGVGLDDYSSFPHSFTSPPDKNGVMKEVWWSLDGDTLKVVEKHSDGFEKTVTGPLSKLHVIFNTTDAPRGSPFRIGLGCPGESELSGPKTRPEEKVLSVHVVNADKTTKDYMDSSVGVDFRELRDAAAFAATVTHLNNK